MKKRLFFYFAFSLICFPLALPAEELSYDRYAPEREEGASMKGVPESDVKNFGRHFLVYPFALVRWPVDRTLVFIEDHRLEDKAQWIYEQMKNHGFTPKVRSLFGGDSLGAGFDIELIKMAGLKGNLPHTTVEGSTLWTLDSITDYRIKLLQDQIGETGARVGANLHYENRGEEHFYGIGPNTSLGDGTSYRMERTTLEGLVGYDFLNTWDAQAKFAFQNANITNGEDGGRGMIDEIFVRDRRQTIPGLGGDKIVSWVFEVQHDNRDSRELPTEGGFQRFHFSYNKGIESSAGYLQYRAEAARFFKTFSERRVFSLRGLLEHNDEVGDREVPFFNMARLGGYGTFPRYGDTHRGYRRDRFYDESLLLLNAEYRWNVLEYRDWRLDPALYCDIGQVFGEWSKLQMDDFKLSYGISFRVSFEKEVVLTLDIARGNEGTEFYVKTRTPF